MQRRNVKLPGPLEFRGAEKFLSKTASAYIVVKLAAQFGERRYSRKREISTLFIPIFSQVLKISLMRLDYGGPQGPYVSIRNGRSLVSICLAKVFAANCLAQNAVLAIICIPQDSRKWSTLCEANANDARAVIVRTINCLKAVSNDPDWSSYLNSVPRAVP
eukprot:6173846-Pleurochrysis_carterae.AAC.1